MSNLSVYQSITSIMYKTGLLLVLFFFSLEKSPGQIYESKDQAFQKASVEGKPIFLVFSGSDWCLPCIKFDKEVLSTAEFQKFSQKQLVVLRADFPQRKEQDEAIVKQNEDLAETYNPQGYFPYLVLLDNKGLIITRFTYSNQGVLDFIDGFDPYIENSLMQSAKKEVYLMGSNFEITIVDSSVEKSWLMIEESIAEIKRIEDLISSWNDLSQTSKINANAGVSLVKVDQEVYNLIKRSLAISQLSEGAFDITFKGVGGLYIFDKEEHELPEKSQISDALKSVGYMHVKLQPADQVYLDRKGVSIGFGAIGKGYAADMAKQLMIKKGVQNGVINASGDLTVWGHQADGKPWKVGIANPMDKDEMLFWVPVENKSVATSGDYEKFFESDGVRYAHIINPITGYPTTGLMSVTVFSSSAELSDALATTVFVMGVDAGLDLINQMQDISCIIIEDLDHIHFSNGLKIYDTKANNLEE